MAAVLKHGFFLLLAVSAFAQPPPEPMSCFQGNSRKADDCCSVPTLMSKPIVDRCNNDFKGLFVKPPPGARKTEGSCIADCVFRHIRAYNATTKTLNTTAVMLEMMKTAGHSRDFVPLFNSTVQTCYTMVTSNPVFRFAPISPVPGRAGCSFLPSALLDCIKIQLFTNCPANHWRKFPECDALKVKLANGCTFSSIVLG